MATKKTWHPDFIAYCEKLIRTEEFEGFPVTRKKDGGIAWVKTKNSKEGKLRTEWWKKKAISIGLPTTGAWITKVARTIHPFGKRPCQICGSVMDIRYVHPQKRTIKSINKHLSTNFDYRDFKTIFEIAEIVDSEYGQSGLQSLAQALKIPFDNGDGLEKLIENIDDDLVLGPSSKFSPGAMGNPPDRLDGYHTYNICCRSKEDTGRHTENMSTYNQDRRAYEQWAEGGLKVADRMMRAGAGDGICAMCGESKKMTADHIGPISLGFAHRHDGFQPLCSSCQGGKRDRLFKRDIDILIQQENEGSHVVSWHVVGLWNNLKHDVQTDTEGERLSIAMKRNQGAYLSLLYKIYSRGNGIHLLPYLDPTQFHYDVEFRGIKPGLYECEGVNLIPGNKDQYTNNAGRYLRVSFDSLNDYASKDNRRIISVESQEIKDVFTEVARTLAQSNAIPQVIVDNFEQARNERDKNHRSRLMLGAWNKWDGANSPRDESVHRSIHSYMVAVWNQLIKEW